MTTLSQLRSDIRTDLKDTNSASYQWPDDVLDIYIKDAIRDYSVYFPLEKDATITTVAGMNDYAWPTDFQDVVRVEYPEGFLLRQIQPKSGTVIWPYLSLTYSYGYESYGGKLRLLLVPDAEETIRIRYLAYRAVPAADDDVLDVPDTDLELLRLYAMAKAYARTAGQDARLSRWRDQGRRDDNPIAPRAEDFLDEYYRKIAERKRHVRMRLVRGR